MPHVIEVSSTQGMPSAARSLLIASCEAGIGPLFVPLIGCALRQGNFSCATPSADPCVSAERHVHAQIAINSIPCKLEKLSLPGRVWAAFWPARCGHWHATCTAVSRVSYIVGSIGGIRGSAAVF